MATSTSYEPGNSFIRGFTALILLAFASGLGAAMFFIAQPQDLADIGGPEAIESGTKPRNLNKVLKTALDLGIPVTLTETEINVWLHQTLMAKQGGALAPKVSFKNVWVRLAEGHAEVIMERSIMGKPFTVSMFVKINQTEGEQGRHTEIEFYDRAFHADVPAVKRGGRFGKLVVPQGFLILVMPAYTKLAELYAEETRLAFQEMSRISIEPGRLRLESRDPETVPNTN